MTVCQNFRRHLLLIQSIRSTRNSFFWSYFPLQQHCLLYLRLVTLRVRLEWFPLPYTNKTQKIQKKYNIWTAIERFRLPSLQPVDIGDERAQERVNIVPTMQAPLLHRSRFFHYKFTCIHCTLKLFFSTFSVLQYWMLCKYPMNTNYLQGFFCVYCDYNKPCILVILTKKTPPS